MCSVPFKLHRRNSQIDFSPYMKVVKAQPIHTTSFSLIGTLHLKLADLRLQPPWILSKVGKRVSCPPESNILDLVHTSEASVAQNEFFILSVS
jgi:hypothetical protein